MTGLHVPLSSGRWNARIDCKECAAKDKQELDGFGVTADECFSDATRDAVNLHDKSNVQQAFMRLGELIDAKEAALKVADEMAKASTYLDNGYYICKLCGGRTHREDARVYLQHMEHCPVLRYRTAREGTR